MSHCDFAAGYAGGVIGLLVGHPLDTIKVNQQTKGIGIRTCIQEVLSQAGFKGFYRGVGFPLIAQGTLNSIFFGAYGIALEELQKFQTIKSGRTRVFCEGELTPTGSSVSQSQEPNYSNVFIAGCVAGSVHTLFACPVEVIKIKLQVIRPEQMKQSPQGSIRLIKHILKTQGFRGLYQGMAATAWRDCPSFGVYMLAYEIGSNQVRNWSSNKSDEMPSSFGLFMAGGIAGATSWTSILPLDVIKSQIQAQDPTRPDFKNGMACTIHVFKTQGIKGFFRGFWSLTLRAFPVNGATLLTYEWFMFLCKYFNENGNEYDRYNNTVRISER